jgi:aminopeptidase YwaD
VRLPLALGCALVTLGLACEAPWSERPDPARSVSPARPDDAADREPLTHLRVLASEAMRGRGSGSPGFAAASRYARELLGRYGFAGAFPGDTVDPYVQPFELGFLSQADWCGCRCQCRSGEPETAPRRPERTQPEPRWGVALFEHGFHLPAHDGPAAMRLLEELRGSRLGRDAVLPESLDSLDALRTSAVTVAVHNVGGILHGTGALREEVIVVLAHLDHLGEASGSVCHGADDNASGSAVVLSALPTLEALQNAGRLDRSVLVLLTAAEECGLVGSDRFFSDPPIPLERIAGVINLDMVGRRDTWRISVIDTDPEGHRLFLSVLLEEANGALPDPFLVHRDIDLLVERQDGWNSQRRGVPTLFLFEGLSNPRGGGALHRDYHKPSDTVERIVKDHGGEKMRRVRDLLVGVVERASSARVPPDPSRDAPGAGPKPPRNAASWR